MITVLLYLVGIIPAFYVISRYIFSEKENEDSVTGLIFVTVFYPIFFIVVLVGYSVVRFSDVFSRTIIKLASFCRK